MCVCVYFKWHGLHLKYPIFSSYLNQNSILPTGFLQIHKYQIPLKSPQWKPSCSMRTDGLTGRTKLKAVFRNFAKALKTGPNQMMTIRPQTQSQYTGCQADSVFEFNSVGDRFESEQGHRQHLMGILVSMFMVYKIISWLLPPYRLQFPVQSTIVPFGTISEVGAIWTKAESNKYWCNLRKSTVLVK